GDPRRGVPQTVPVRVLPHGDQDLPHGRRDPVVVDLLHDRPAGGVALVRQDRPVPVDLLARTPLLDRVTAARGRHTRPPGPRRPCAGGAPPRPGPTARGRWPWRASPPR